MTKIPGFYTTQEIAARFQWGRDQVSKTARREEWGTVTVGTSNLYNAADVDEYAEARDRTRIGVEAGWWSNGKGLIRYDDYDLVCPICGFLAIQKPPAPDEMEEWMNGNWPWRCIQGHTNI